MDLLSLFIILLSASINCTFMPEDTHSEDAEKSVAEYVLSYGYKFEEHKVVTKDGYILTLWRIPKKMYSRQKPGRPVLLQHGLLDNGFSFLFQEIHKNLPMKLINEGNYDIWISNSRGTIRSLEHMDKKEFNWADPSSRYWDFSWDEMGLYDFPAILDHIVDVTGYESINYVCHSQGCSSLLAYASKKLDIVNKRLGKVVWLAPGMFPREDPSWIVHFLFDQLHALDILGFFNFKNVMAHPFIMKLSKLAGEYIPGVWLWALNLLCGFTEEEHIDPKRVPVVAANQFGGSSLQNFQHWAQMIHGSKFQMHDFGEKENLRRYGQIHPPLYDTKPYKKFSFPSIVFSFGRDGLVSPESVIRFLGYMPDKSYKYEEIPDTNHLSGFWSDSSHKTLYPKIITFFKE